MKKRNAKNELKLSQMEVQTLRRLISCLIGDKHWTPYLPYKPDWIAFPRHLAFEGAVLKAIYELEQMERQGREKYGDSEPFPPTYENVLTILQADDRFQDHERMLKDLMGYRTQTADPRPHAKALENAIKKTITVGGLEEAIKAVQMYADVEEGHRQAQRILREAKPTAADTRWYSGTELNQEMMTWWREGTELARSGKRPGPIFPWKKFQDYIPFLQRGNQYSIIATAGLGKSTVTDELASYWAYVQGGHAVFILSLENSKETFRERQIARYMHMNLKHVMNKFYYAGDEKCILDDSHPAFWEPFQRFISEVDEKERTMGKVFYIPCPMASLDDIDGFVEEAKMEARLLGLDPVFILDYLNEVVVNGSARKFGGSDGDPTINTQATGIKNIAQAQNVPFLTFAQDQIDPDYDSGRVKSYNGQKLYMRSQAYIRLEAERVDADMQKEVEVTRDGRKSRQRDTFFLTGEPVYWHEAGGLSSYVTWNVLKNNNGRTGDTFCTQICRPLFEIYEAAKPKKSN